MRITRIYQPIPLSKNLIFELMPTAANHLVRVLRFAVGDEFVVFNGEGGEFFAKIVEIKKQHVLVQVAEHKNNSVESPLRIHLVQAVSRGEKMDYTIQKAVELGATEITPLLTERCGVKLSGERWDKKMQHWQGIIISACEQSGRDRIPMLNNPMPFTQWLSQANAELKLILHPIAAQKINDLQKQPQSIDLLIGPEGGFDEVEVRLAQQQGFISLQLGPRILRTETAALVGITILQCKWGDL